MSDLKIQIKIKSFICLLLFICTVQFSFAHDRKTVVVEAVEKVGASVVNISSEYEIRKQNHPFGFNPLFDNFFGDFFEPRTQKRANLGSGVIIDGERGYILTNAHVIEKRATIKVLLQDERQFEAQIVGADPDSDLAVLKILSKNGLPSVAMGNSDDILIGETVIAIGNPFGFSNTVTTGVISAVHRSLKFDQRNILHDLIQTDASINPGNSGGPLLNINGDLIGINTAIYSKAQGIGFAIPINKAKRIVDDLISYGHVIQAWLGFGVQELDPRTANYLDLKASSGVIVAQVENGGPAGQAGLETGDFVLAINKDKVNSHAAFQAITKGITAGDTIEIKIIRAGKTKKLKLKTSVFPENKVPDLVWRTMGLTLQDIDKTSKNSYRSQTNQGVVISAVRKNSYLSSVGVEPGDIILQVDEHPISSMKDFTKAAIKTRLKQSLVILLKRHGQLYHLTVKKPH
ncbi:MAG: Do family serine endopeptidase [Desulfobacteraceae bacterium]|nr:Do family serine endopeptidase [Desulfobacteraceae bacterium]